MQQSDATLPLDAAYEAARVRAARTTDALILAEGQVLDLTRRLATITAERDQYATEAGKAAMARARRRLRDRARRARRKGGEDATEDTDPIGYTGAIGQAD